jgi:hypothetical protein
MNRTQIKDLIFLILNQADYDLAKAYDPETAEEPEYASEQLEEMIDVVGQFFEQLNSKPNLNKKAKKKSK